MKLAFETFGQGYPFILIHAFPLSNKMWFRQIESITDQNFQLILPDLPGFGKTQNFSDVGLLGEMARDVFELIEDLKIERAVIGGLSMGGYVTFDLFANHPEKFSALVLCDTTFAADTEEKRLARFDLIGQIEKYDSRALIDNMLPKLISDQTKVEQPNLVKELQQMFAETNSLAAIAALRGMAQRKDHQHILAEISVPTALIFGAEDSITNIETARIMKRKISDSQLFIIENAGHYSNLEQPILFNESLAKFLNSLKMKKI